MTDNINAEDLHYAIKNELRLAGRGVPLADLFAAIKAGSLKLGDAELDADFGEFQHIAGVAVTPDSHNAKTATIITADGAEQVPAVLVERGVRVAIMLRCESSSDRLLTLSFHKGEVYLNCVEIAGKLDTEGATDDVINRSWDIWRD